MVKLNTLGFCASFLAKEMWGKNWSTILVAQSELDGLEISFFYAPQSPGVKFWHLELNFLASSLRKSSSKLQVLNKHQVHNAKFKINVGER